MRCLERLYVEVDMYVTPPPHHRSHTEQEPETGAPFTQSYLHIDCLTHGEGGCSLKSWSGGLTVAVILEWMIFEQ